MGNPDRANDIEAVREAATHGGALEFIEALPKRFDAAFEWDRNTCNNGEVPKGSKLEKVVKTIEPEKLELSGGQNQRLAL